MALIVLAAAFDVLGPRVNDASVSGDGYALAVEYPLIARAGELSSLVVTITSDRAFGDTVEVRFCAEYFEHLDFQSWCPGPSAETSDLNWLVYEFDKPVQGQVL
ncbi:hypothetical protein [Nocardioides okcheonensis]|uniref:hypothetical protein n=1 Tax=Nocardioides okcheonensis TaxID=2894081 RepID=UPI001E416590|nr:hypothetical protein [Nocardioides okcheonensis]UFN45147.1 hypothetical protein LN652_02720 [Nocardioides okcheonensis]